MTTVATEGRGPEWTPMLKRIVLLLTIVTMGGGIICSVVYGIWTVSGFLGNIDHSIQELTKSGDERDKKVQAVKAAFDDPDSPVNKTLKDHGSALVTLGSKIDDAARKIDDLASQTASFETKATGSPPKPKDPGHDGHR